MSILARDSGSALYAEKVQLSELVANVMTVHPHILHL